MTLGLVYIGCNLVPSTSAILELLEATTPELSDNPLNRTEPVAKCGLAAIKQRYEYFGVSIGYCISGSNNIEDYNNSNSYYPGWCNDGVGEVYYSGSHTYYFMDVYKVTDVSSFNASADSAISPDSVTTVPPSLVTSVPPSLVTTIPSSSVTAVPPSPVTTVPPSPTMGGVANGVDVHKYSFLLLSISLVTVLGTLLR